MIIEMRQYAPASPLAKNFLDNLLIELLTSQTAPLIDKGIVDHDAPS